MNTVIVEPTENSIVIELVDVFTTYYMLQAAQSIPEHQGVQDEPT